MTDHEKRIREASNYALDNEWSYLVVENADLRALLADLDEARQALKYARRFLNAQDHDVAYVDAALKGASHE